MPFWFDEISLFLMLHLLPTQIWIPLQSLFSITHWWICGNRELPMICIPINLLKLILDFSSWTLLVEFTSMIIPPWLKLETWVCYWNWITVVFFIVRFAFLRPTPQLGKSCVPFMLQTFRNREVPSLHRIAGIIGWLHLVTMFRVIVQLSISTVPLFRKNYESGLDSNSNWLNTSSCASNSESPRSWPLSTFLLPSLPFTNL